MGHATTHGNQLIFQGRIKDNFDLETRKFLLNGCMLIKHYANQRPRPRMIKVNENFDSLIISDPEKPKTEALIKPFSNMKEVNAGACTDSLAIKKFGYDLPKPEHCFGIFFHNSADDHTLSLEAANFEDVTKWVNALYLLIKFNKGRVYT